MKHLSVLVALAMVSALVFLPAPGIGAPGVMTYQGNLANAEGMPLNGSYVFVFRIYGDTMTGTPWWAETHFGVVVAQGKFAVELGSLNPIPDSVFAGEPYLQVSVGGETLTPWTRLTSHPYSFRVQTLDGSTGGTVSGTVVLRIDEAKSGHEAIRVEEPDGDPLITAAAEPGVSTKMTFYDPVDSKGGMATTIAAQFGSDGFLAYEGVNDTALSYFRGKRLRVNSHGSRGGIFIADSVGSIGGWFQGESGGMAAVCAPLGQTIGGSFSAVSANCSGGMGDNYGLWGLGSSPFNSYGVYGTAQGTGTNYGVRGYATGGTANYGVYGEAPVGAGTAYAGYFQGNVHVTGTLSKGAGSFKIDHPLDPENKYLYHSFVESPDMKNVYDGVITLDARGEATVELPEYFETLNRDFRYQLTAVGAAMPELHVAEEVWGNVFRIAGGVPGKKVSWQVTGIRQDPFANEYRIPVEEVKEGADRAKYLYPEVYGLGKDRRIGPEEAKPLQVPESGVEE